MKMTTAEMQADYEVLGFAYGICVVKRKSDNVKGTLDFYREGDTRFYTNFMEA